jgi:hypothetical protein
MKPTKKWLEDQKTACLRAMWNNEGAMNLLQQMIDNGIFIEEGEKDGVIKNEIQP